MRSPTIGPIVLDLAALDRAVYGVIAITPTPSLDGAMRRLSYTANHSKISFALAGLLALRSGPTRRAALLGVAAIGVASAAANLLGKNLVRRERPDRLGALVPEARHVPMPTSASFPSGHSASAFAFAVAVGAELPRTAVPLCLLAATVAYSRVHTGVHYPGDVMAGALLGVASATAVRITLA
ncbi:MULTISPECIES: phosphatase PAP2 family protein [unclassified Kitasatospora]|uniref:phosphatase PAP2 family protein n=1 Tax=unclassified Kitasatospora TaxID=2633591 RepID=UPI00070D7546|nr:MULTISPECIES: phosphatase PAP2 family protein [unclassified Kitasatospora]KQV24053.1 phosphoesterase [Kitasatospora sp. Root107]KRB67232.1 phosphoesterase [Kitasatospora sp. Root187]